MRNVMLRHNIKTAAIILTASLAGCAEQAQVPPSREISASDALAAAKRVVDCEWAAADKFDDGHSPLSSLAQRVMGVCTPQMYEARLVVGISPADPSVDAEELRQAIDNVEAARKHRLNLN
jgi:predicted outer membrane protein